MTSTEGAGEQADARQTPQYTASGPGSHTDGLAGHVHEGGRAVRETWQHQREGNGN